MVFVGTFTNKWDIWKGQLLKKEKQTQKTKT